MNESDAILGNIRQITNRLQARFDRVWKLKEKTVEDDSPHFYCELCGRLWELDVAIKRLEGLLEHWKMIKGEKTDERE